MSDSKSPNAGENVVSHSGSSEGKRPMGTLSAGVADGLSSNSSISVKNAESVTGNQRPKGRTEKAGSFKCGVSQEDRL